MKINLTIYNNLYIICVVYLSNISYMWIKKSILATAVWAMIMTGCSDFPNNNSNAKKNDFEHTKREVVHKTPLVYLQDSVNNQTFVCLNTDNEDSYTHKNALETVSDPENTVLEYPISQLFQKYWKNKSNHPLYVSWGSKTFNSLMWSNWIEESNVDQKLNTRKGLITSKTTYEVWDTLRFALIDQRLKWAFPENLSEQLKEEWFETFSNLDSLKVEPQDNNSQIFEYGDFNKYYWKPKSEKETNTDFVYDIVVKSLPWWKSALAVYRNWKLFMATYVSVWTFGRKTMTWQHKIERREPYKRSTKYNNSAMPFGLNYKWWYYFHQWNVTWNPLSHGCVRLPWVYASVLYSLAKDEENVDVFIDNNLYKLK